MADGLKIEFKGTNALVAYLKARGEAAAYDAGYIITDMTLKIRQRALEKLSGEVLSPGTGKLRNALRTETSVTGAGITGRVFVSGSEVPYAAIQEYGGRTSPHDILPVRAGVLAFMSPAKLGISKPGSSAEVYAKIVHHPGSRMPERSYLRSSLAEYRAELIDRLRGIVK